MHYLLARRLADASAVVQAHPRRRPNQAQRGRGLASGRSRVDNVWVVRLSLSPLRLLLAECLRLQELLREIEKETGVKRSTVGDIVRKLEAEEKTEGGQVGRPPIGAVPVAPPLRST